MSKVEPLVSIVMPCFNARATIERAVDSVLVQTEIDWELIVVDDASRDDTGGFVARQYKSDPRISTLRLEINGGPARARNVALDAARGRWITLLDADDSWHPSRLSRLRLADDGDHDVVFDNLLEYDFHAGVEIGSLFPEFGSGELSARELLADRAPDSHYNFGYLKPSVRREFIQRHGLRYDETLRTGEDRLFFLNLLLEGARTRRGDEALYIYTAPRGSASGVVSPTSHSVPDDNRVIAALHQIVGRYNERVDDETRAAIEECAAHLRREGPKAKFYHARAHGNVLDMLRIAMRERSVRQDVVAKAKNRCTSSLQRWLA